MKTKKRVMTNKSGSEKRQTTNPTVTKGIPTRMPPRKDSFSKQKIENHGLIDNLSGVATLKKAANKTNQNR